MTAVDREPIRESYVDEPSRDHPKGPDHVVGKLVQHLISVYGADVVASEGISVKHWRPKLERFSPAALHHAIVIMRARHEDKPPTLDQFAAYAVEHGKQTEQPKRRPPRASSGDVSRNAPEGLLKPRPTDSSVASSHRRMIAAILGVGDDQGKRELEAYLQTPEHRRHVSRMRRRRSAFGDE